MKGIGFLVLAILINSLQNVAVKWIGGNYSVLEIVALRSLIALPCTLLLYRYEGRREPVVHRIRPSSPWKEGMVLNVTLPTL